MRTNRLKALVTALTATPLLFLATPASANYGLDADKIINYINANGDFTCTIPEEGVYTGISVTVNGATGYTITRRLNGATSGLRGTIDASGEPVSGAAGTLVPGLADCLEEKQ